MRTCRCSRCPCCRCRRRRTAPDRNSAAARRRRGRHAGRQWRACEGSCAGFLWTGRGGPRRPADRDRSDTGQAGNKGWLSASCYLTFGYLLWAEMSGCRTARLVSSRVVPLLGVVALTACSPGTDSAVGLTTPAGLSTPVPSVVAKVKAAPRVTPAAKAAMRRKTPVVLGFGDSVPAGGGHCNCTNFVTAYG